MLAGVGAAALAIPGIETAHWLSRAFLMGSMVVAVCGFLVGAMLPGVFCIFFDEDLGIDPSIPSPRHLTMETDHVLLHHINKLFEAPSTVS